MRSVSGLLIKQLSLAVQIREERQKWLKGWNNLLLATSLIRSFTVRSVWVRVCSHRQVFWLPLHLQTTAPFWSGELFPLTRAQLWTSAWAVPAFRANLKHFNQEMSSAVSFSCQIIIKSHLITRSCNSVRLCERVAPFSLARLQCHSIISHQHTHTRVLALARRSLSVELH